MPTDPGSHFPVDDSDRRLIGHTHPPGWRNPTPTGRYNLVALGGGAAGLVSVMGTAGLGGRAAIVEANLLGGDCLVSGCVPSKALLRAARSAHEARTAGRFGVRVGSVEVDFPAVMGRVRATRAHIAPHDSAARLRDAGVDVFLGRGRFVAPDTVEVDGQALRFDRAVIATGGRAIRPDVPGLAEVGALTNDEVWDLTELPRRLVVVGGGPIGCELAQAFGRLGSAVTLVEAGPRLLPRDDPQASALIERRLRAEGVDVRLGAAVARFARAGGEKVVVVGGAEIACDAILLAVGRRPNVDGLGLEAAGVRTGARGVIEADARLRTSNPRIYVAGDVAGRLQFTHAADAMARVVVRNALFWGRASLDDLRVPWVTYTDPEVGHVGMSAEQAAAAGARTIEVPLAGNDRAVVDDETEGFARVHHDPKGRILGATVVAPRAGELVAAVTVAMTAGVTLGQLASAVWPYPTEAEVLKRAGDAFNRTRLTPTAAGVLRAILRWRA